MASPAAASRPALFLFLVVVALAASGAGAANFFVTNMCHFPVWSAAIPTGGGAQLNPGQMWHVPVPAGTTGRIWARTDCYFRGDHGWCKTGDCEGAMRCELPGKPPVTLAEFAIGGVVGENPMDSYDISVVFGFNVPMDFLCGSGDDVLRCREPECADAGGRHPGDLPKILTCRANSDYHVVFCP